MAKIIEHDGGFSLDQLQDNLRLAEAAKRKLTKIEGKDGSTFSTHDMRTRVAPDSLVIVLDPDGDAKGPDGSTPIVRGSAVIEGDEVKVACFRLPG
jgi:hypothetical protein